MADINQLIAPVTSKNTVNSIFILQGDHIPSTAISNPKKGKIYESNYVKVKQDFGKLKIKEFISNFQRNENSLVGRAYHTKQQAIDYESIDQYKFILQASKADLKKIKPEQYFGLRRKGDFVYDFNDRQIYRIVDEKRNKETGEIEKLVYDAASVQPMFNPVDYRGIFIDKLNKPVIKSNLVSDIEETAFQTHQSLGPEPEYPRYSQSIRSTMSNRSIHDEDDEDDEDDKESLGSAYTNPPKHVERMIRKICYNILETFVNKKYANAAMEYDIPDLYKLVANYESYLPYEFEALDNYIEEYKSLTGQS